jgi:hypothetical protein
MSSIVPFSQTTTNVIASFTVMVNSVALFSSAQILVSNYTAEGKFVNAVNLNMTGSDYTNWGGDDTYVIHWAATQLGYTLDGTTTGSVSYIG